MLTGEDAMDKETRNFTASEKDGIGVFDVP